MKHAIRTCCLLVLALSGYCQKADTPYVIMISFDGFRYDYVDKFNAPHFKRFRMNGTQAEALIPVFPSKTFPNHYSIVTGLYAGHHGLVDNNFFDPHRNEFYEMKNTARKTDPYYYGGKPLWKLAREQGVKSASFFWVGSELPQPGLHPDYYYPYDDTIPDTVRVRQVINWLKLPEKERPHLITLYFSSPDHEGHTYGPSSTETRNAVLHADQMVGKLRKAIEAIPLPVNIIIVSDHGMEELTENPETYIFLDDILDRSDTTIKVSNGGTQAHVYINNKSKVDSIYRRLKTGSKKYSVYTADEFPSHWHYSSTRAGDILMTANQGFYIVTQEKKSFLSSIKTGKYFGAHGYDASVVKNMRGIFYAMGPNIKSGKKIPAFENIHIYPFIASLLGLTTPVVDGDPRVLKDIIVR
ncbi:ectonucleotide pyrophosphatase/phosphodiesterase [Chryseolinea sp. H1M3-3]|uniref:alkaline phosphatase family protein n=1 Tax=Chryseolinea sp. H1M3-3 TaxID=3034144 RepID=UPI0023EC4720|nr:ectonucleotide pyrophosphatase/phosphodiesterase [Chryseolinea sp. H1M3-3]